MQPYYNGNKYDFTDRQLGNQNRSRLSLWNRQLLHSTRSCERTVGIAHMSLSLSINSEHSLLLLIPTMLMAQCIEHKSFALVDTLVVHIRSLNCRVPKAKVKDTHHSQSAGSVIQKQKRVRTESGAEALGLLHDWLCLYRVLWCKGSLKPPCEILYDLSALHPHYHLN